MSQFLKIEAFNHQLDHQYNQKPYQHESKGIEISVWIEFLNNKLTNFDEIFIWVYQIRIENHNKFPIKLISRHFKIIDQNGDIKEVNDEGIIGEQVEIESQKSFQYCSGVHLKYPSGIFIGNYLIKNLENNKEFEVDIPRFSLDIPQISTVLN